MKTVIEMALEAGILEPIDLLDSNQWRQDTIRELERFAELVRADEREACAKVCDHVVMGKNPDDIHSDSQWAALTLAAEIRARGTHET